MSSAAASAEATGVSGAAQAKPEPPVRRVRIYTRTGDKGTTSLFNGSRQSKAASFFEALGDTDELNAQLAVAKEHCKTRAATLVPQLEEIQSRLFDVGAHIATPKSSSAPDKLQRVAFPEESVATLEGWIDAMEEQLEPLRNFILPGGGLAAAHLHVARTVARRAERHVVGLVEQKDADEVVLRYLNRLSDFFFVAARFAAMKEGAAETLWRKPPAAP
jgi:ATP:cob(I)alamin adenosyltransferase